MFHLLAVAWHYLHFSVTQLGEILYVSFKDYPQTGEFHSQATSLGKELGTNPIPLVWVKFALVIAPSCSSKVYKWCLNWLYHTHPVNCHMIKYWKFSIYYLLSSQLIIAGGTTINIISTPFKFFHCEKFAKLSWYLFPDYKIIWSVWSFQETQMKQNRCYSPGIHWQP